MNGKKIIPRRKKSRKWLWSKNLRLLRRWRATSWRQRILIFLFMILVYQLFRVQVHNLFGNGTMNGGSIGSYVDKRLLRYNIRTKWKQRQKELEDSGVMLPVLDIRNNRFVKETPSPFSHLAESLSRTVLNKRRIWNAEKVAEQWKQSCHQKPTDTANSNIPRQILQLNVGDLYRPLSNFSTLTEITFDDTDMRQLVEQVSPQLLPKYDSAADDSTKTSIFSLCSLYWYGGYLFDSTVRDVSQLIQEANHVRPPCTDQAVVIMNQGVIDFQHEEPLILMLAATPRHQAFHCLMDKIAASDTNVDVRRLLLSLLFDDDEDLKDLQFKSLIRSEDAVNADSWLLLCSECGNLEETNCCDFEKRLTCSGEESHIFVRGSSTPERYKRPALASTGASHARVTVGIQDPKSSSVATMKESIAEKLDKINCIPSWLCHRCLRTELFGSFKSCSFLCAECYENMQCDTAAGSKKLSLVTVDTQEKRALGREEMRIPRIIHQTWSVDLSSDKIPELARLQNSWRASGFEYRFYNDTAARFYVKRNFPSRFLDSYDSFIPGAFKADLFRLLVLLKEGGIYADFDVLLETNLDFFLTPEMSFFVPRETIRDLSGNDYCLWNGLIGAAPGHPIIAKAVERLLETTIKRADYLDVEQYACRKDGRKAQLWKLRSLPTLILSGPCALGMAANEVLGREIMSNFTPGWFLPTQKGSQENLALGDVLILMSDKQDMGYLRFADVERNLVVASTDMPDLSKKPFLDVETQSGPLRPHYSQTEFESDIYGSKGVYVDRLAVDESIEINLSHVSV